MADRELQPVRTPIERNSPPAVITPRQSLLDTRDTYSRGVTDNADVKQGDTSFAQKPLSPYYGEPAPNTTINSGVSSSGQVQRPLYGDGDPFRIAADLFSRFYGGAPTEQPQAPVVVGDASIGQSRGSNTGLLILLVVIGVAGYYLYRRYAS